jgi:hypothetical protein
MNPNRGNGVLAPSEQAAAALLEMLGRQQANDMVDFITKYGRESVNIAFTGTLTYSPLAVIQEIDERDKVPVIRGLALFIWSCLAAPGHAQSDIATVLSNTYGLPITEAAQYATQVDQFLVGDKGATIATTAKNIEKGAEMLQQGKEALKGLEEMTGRASEAVSGPGGQEMAVSSPMGNILFDFYQLGMLSPKLDARARLTRSLGRIRKPWSEKGFNLLRGDAQSDIIMGDALRVAGLRRLPAACYGSVGDIVEANIGDATDALRKACGYQNGDPVDILGDPDDSNPVVAALSGDAQEATSKPNPVIAGLLKLAFPRLSMGAGIAKKLFGGDPHDAVEAMMGDIARTANELGPDFVHAALTGDVDSLAEMMGDAMDDDDISEGDIQELAEGEIAEGGPFSRLRTRMQLRRLKQRNKRQSARLAAKEQRYRTRMEMKMRKRALKDKYRNEADGDQDFDSGRDDFSSRESDEGGGSQYEAPESGGDMSDMEGFGEM